MHELVLDALLMAVWRRKPTKSVIVHSDRGSQYGTGAKKVVSAAVLDKAKDGVFMLNFGHVAEEIACN